MLINGPDQQDKKRPDTSVDADSDVDFKSSKNSENTKSSKRNRKKRRTGSLASKVSSRNLDSDIVLSSDRMDLIDDVANLNPVQVDEEMKSEYRQSVDQISSNMNIDSNFSSKYLSLDHSSGRKVYHDESLVETLGNLFPRIDT